VQPRCVELVEPHERVGLKQGAIRVSLWVQGPAFPFAKEEIVALPFKLRIGTPWLGLAVEGA